LALFVCGIVDERMIVVVVTAIFSSFQSSRGFSCCCCCCCCCYCADVECGCSSFALLVRAITSDRHQPFSPDMEHIPTAAAAAAAAATVALWVLVWCAVVVLPTTRSFIMNHQFLLSAPIIIRVSYHSFWHVVKTSTACNSVHLLDQRLSSAFPLKGSSSYVPPSQQKTEASAKEGNNKRRLQSSNKE
jgi:hypothetical protein